MVWRRFGRGISGGERPCPGAGHAGGGRTRQRRRFDCCVAGIPHQSFTSGDGRAGPGGEVTVTAADKQATRASEEADPAVPARWATRAGALALDILPAVALLVITVLVSLSVPQRSTWWWACVCTGAVIILLTAFNRLVLPVFSGQSLGRAVLGATVVRPNGDAVGPWWLLLRDLAHLLDTAAVLLGWLWPLWDSRGRTFADMLLATESRLVAAPRSDRNLRRLAAGLGVA